MEQECPASIVLHRSRSGHSFFQRLPGLTFTIPHYIPRPALLLKLDEMSNNVQ